MTPNEELKTCASSSRLRLFRKEDASHYSERVKLIRIWFNGLQGKMPSQLRRLSSQYITVWKSEVMGN